jgi:hypothetical protein
MDLTELFCFVDDVCLSARNLWDSFHLPQLPASYTSTRLSRRKSRMSISECCTIVIAFHQSSFRCFKHFYLRHVQVLWKPYFPSLVSYQRFVELMPRTLVPLVVCLHALRGKCTGLAFVDATSIPVCHNRRIPSHRVFRGIASRGKTSTGWFFGFKLHIIINECGDILSWALTPGNVDDRQPMHQLTKNLLGKVYGDKGYISQELFEALFSKGVELVTKRRKNMKNKLVSEFDKCMLRKRALIETVNDQLKNISMLEHTRHRSLQNFVVNVLCALIAYCLQPKKPSIQDEVFPTQEGDNFAIA